MGTTNLISPELQKKISSTILVLCVVLGVLVLAIWCYLLLNLVGIVTWPKPLLPPAVMMMFGTSIAFLCADLWFLNQIGILNLAEPSEKLIRTGLIVSVLGTVAAAIAKAF